MVKKLHLILSCFFLLAIATSSLARAWTDRDGNKTSGTLLRVSGVEIEVVATDGRTVKIPFTSLVPADPRYLVADDPSRATAALDTPTPVTPPITRTASSPSAKDWPVGRPKPPRVRSWVDRQGNNWTAEYYDVSTDGNVSFKNNTQGSFAVPFRDLSDADQAFIRRTMANPILPKEKKKEEADEETFLESLDIDTYHPPLWAYYIFFASMVILVLAIIVKAVERMMKSDAN